MALAIFVFITWCAIIIFSLVPKKMSELDMVFLFFINTIFELSIFTIVHLNLHWIEVIRSVEKSMADLVYRLIMIPLFLILSSNFLLYSWKYLKWAGAIAILLSFVGMHWLEKRLGIMMTPHWNMLYSVAMFSGYILFSRIMTWFILRVGRKEVQTP